MEKKKQPEKRMRRVDTLRVSVTDRCNLRCVYCMPPEGLESIPHKEILRFEEIKRVVTVGVSLGIRKVRITGGEPLVRRDITRLVRMLAEIRGIEDLSMTTNGTLLKRFAKDLKQAGLSRITISLDTLKRDKYKQITLRDRLADVMKGIREAKAQNLFPLKINVVVVKGINDNEIMDFAELAVTEDIEVRFIERMPLLERGDMTQCGWPGKEMVPSKIVREIIEGRFGKLLPAKSGLVIPGPARLFRIPGRAGRIGFISPMTNAFCSSCTRMRLTAEGKLRPCLVEELEFDMKKPLREGKSDKDLQAVFSEAIEKKPFQKVACFSMIQKRMVQIGG
jgi:cyclic pyranopterin phosphate synthase